MYDLKENFKEGYSYFIFVGHTMAVLFLAQNDVGHAERNMRNRLILKDIPETTYRLGFQDNGIGVAWCVHLVGND